jgi:hypothetical protein
MIAPRLLSRPQWEAKLRECGCKPLVGRALNTAELWQRPDGGYPFTVPIVGDDDRCDDWDLQKLIDDLGRNPPPKPFRPKIVPR